MTPGMIQAWARSPYGAAPMVRGWSDLDTRETPAYVMTGPDGGYVIHAGEGLAGDMADTLRAIDPGARVYFAG